MCARSDLVDLLNRYVLIDGDVLNRHDGRLRRQLHRLRHLEWLLVPALLGVVVVTVVIAVPIGTSDIILAIELLKILILVGIINLAVRGQCVETAVDAIDRDQ